MGKLALVTELKIGCISQRNFNGINWRVDINSGKLKVGPPTYRVSYEIIIFPSICLFVHQFSIFLRNSSLIIFSFLARWLIIGIFKTDRDLLPGKFIFVQIWAKRALISPKIGAFLFF